MVAPGMHEGDVGKDGSNEHEGGGAPPAPPRSLALSEHRWLRFTTLCALYFAQGFPWGFISIALVAVLSERGASAQETGKIVALSLLPWTFKIIWGPMIDSYRIPSLGQRRPWIVFAQLMMAMTLFGAFSVADVTAESTMALLGVIFFAHNCFASLQDVATDAMAIDLLDEDERGRVNGFMWCSKLVGISAGGAGMAAIIARGSLQLGMQIMAALILLIMLLPLLLKERPGDKRFPWSRGPHVALEHVHAKTGPLKVARELLRAFTLRATLLGLVLAALTFVGEGLAIPINAEVYTQHLGWSAEKYANAQAIFGTIGKVVGALGGGFLCDRIGVRRIAAVGYVLTVATFLTFALTSRWWSHESYPLRLYFLLLDTGLALTSVSLFALFMRVAWTTAAATQFTLYMTVLNMGHAIGPTLTKLGLEYVPTYVLCAMLSALPLAVLPFIDTAVVLQRKLAESRARAAASP
jgi:PAT family beta-lactamase induction signal transducer AmpG